MPFAVGTGTAAVALAAVVIGGFLVLGVRDGSVDWVRLVSSKVWDPTRNDFGALAMLWGTAVVAALALGIAGPVGWAAAVGLNEVVGTRWRGPLRTIAELLAAVPSIVYGLLGVAFVRPFVSRVFHVPGGDSLFAAGLVLAVMILPTVVALSVDALACVPAARREASAALGLTRWEVTRDAVLPAARPGLRGALLLGLARAFGETVAVYLVIGRADGRLPPVSGVLRAIVRPGQTLTTKLNSPESVLAGTSGPHWGALCALGIVLLASVASLTLVGLRRRSGRRRAPVRDLRRHAARWRHGRNRLAVVAFRAAVAVQAVILVAVVVPVVLRGHAAWRPGYWLSAAYGASGGGVRGQLAGTLLLVAVAGVIAAPAGLALGLLAGEYVGPAASRRLRTATVTLAGVPSIVLGLAGFWLFAGQLGWGKSWLAGGIVLAVIAIPPVTIAVVGCLDRLPAERREAALALGLSRGQLVRDVLLPYVRPCVITGTLLGLARAAGETAPLLFTATVFAGASPVPTGVTNAPVLALPTHVFTLIQDAADPAAVHQAWGAATVLLLVAGALLVAAGRTRRQKERER